MSFWSSTEKEMIEEIFFSLKFDDCRCEYPILCDTFQRNQRNAIEDIEKLVLPSELELRNVHKV